MRRDGEREFVAGEQNAAALFLAQIKMSLELAREVTRFLSCHFQLFQSSGATSGQ